MCASGQGSNYLDLENFAFRNTAAFSSFPRTLPERKSKRARVLELAVSLSWIESVSVGFQVGSAHTQ